MNITKREIIFSVIIICVMIIIGLTISGNINDAVMEKQQKYNIALQIDNDKELFEYGMRTNIGNAFVYGDLKAVDVVSYPEIEGEYAYVEKVKEQYTRHTRSVTKTKTVNGKTKTYTEQQTYWTWDQIGSESKHVEKISFLDVEFDYGAIKFPSASHITTIKESGKIRYVYYGVDTKYTGTLYAELKDDTIMYPIFYNNQDIKSSMKFLATNWEVPVFWVFWVLLICICVATFYKIDNRWLEN